MKNFKRMWAVKFWFFVASYVLTDKNKLTERDVDNAHVQ